jgi:putative oxidoreductase
MNIKMIDYSLLLLRVGFGLSFILLHGWRKIAGGPERWERLGSALEYLGINFLHTFWGFMAAVAEVGGGLLILLGILFRPALSLMIITMFVAFYQHLAKGDGILRAAYPLEMALVLIALFIMGPGKYTLQYFLKEKNKEKK